MRSDKLVDQMEAYSNAIVGFMVAQSLLFSFTLGNNERLATLVKTKGFLGVGLLLHFAVSTLLAVSAIQFLSARLRRLSQEHQDLVKTLFRAKAAVVVLFTLIPILLLLWLWLSEDASRIPREVPTTAAGSCAIRGDMRPNGRLSGRATRAAARCAR